MQTIIGKQEAQAQEALNKCINLQLRDLPASQNTVEAREKIAEQCRAGVRETTHEAPSRAFPLIGWIAIGAVAVGGTVLGVRYLRKRHAERT
jgi:hypothetical protein